MSRTRKTDDLQKKYDELVRPYLGGVTDHGRLSGLGDDDHPQYLHLVNENQYIWPIGSVFIAVVATNPNTLLGYGTWTLLGTGDLTLT